MELDKNKVEIKVSLRNLFKDNNVQKYAAAWELLRKSSVIEMSYLMESVSEDPFLDDNVPDELEVQINPY